MPSIKRSVNLCSGHGYPPPKTSISPNSNIFVNEILVTQAVDIFTTYGGSQCKAHPDKLVTGSSLLSLPMLCYLLVLLVTQ